MRINKQASFTERRGVSQSAVFTELHGVSLPRTVSQVVTVPRDLGTCVPSASRAPGVQRASPGRRALKPDSAQRRVGRRRQGLDRQQLPGKEKQKVGKKEDGARQPEHKDGLC